MASGSVVELHDFAHDDTSDNCGYVPLASPLRLRLRYGVRRAVERPRWSLTCVVDIADRRWAVELVPPTKAEGCDVDGAPQLLPGEQYTVAFDVERVDLSGVEKKYMEHVGALQFVLMSDAERVSEVMVLVQMKRNECGELMRRILSPME